MGDMFDSAPPPPGPAQATQAGAKTAAQQFGYNIGAQQASQPNQQNQFGNIQYTQTGVGANGAPIYQESTNLAPEQQALFDLNNLSKIYGGIGAGGLIGGANYGSTSPRDAIGNMTSGITGQIMGQETNYLNPFFNQSRTQLDTQLRNQGLIPGTPGYDMAMRQMDTSQGLTVSNFLANAEPQAFQQASNLYTMPAQLGMQLGSWSNATSPTSQFVNMPGLQTPDLVGATANAGNMLNNQYGYQLQNYQNKMNGMWGMAGNALGAMAMMSDRRMKRNIKRVMTWFNGLPVYFFQYLWSNDWYIGMMADEVAQVRPEAVQERNGLKYVNYALAMK